MNVLNSKSLWVACLSLLLVACPGANDGNSSTGGGGGNGGGSGTGNGSQPAVVVDLNSLNGSNGFAITGLSAGDQLGYAIDTSGDYDNDNCNDIAVSAITRDVFDKPNAGVTYIIFGDDDIAAEASNGAVNLQALLDSNKAIKIEGAAAADLAGSSLAYSANSLLIGAPGADPAPGLSQAGKVYRVTGPNNDVASDLALTTSLIDGLALGDRLGSVVASAGKLNDDNFTDIILGVQQADSSNFIDTGAVYVLLGNASGTYVDDLNRLNGTNGFKVVLDSNSEQEASYLGSAVAAVGNLNNDDYADVVIGARGFDENNQEDSGQVYVLFGRADFSVDAAGGTLRLNQGDDSDDLAMGGLNELDVLGESVALSHDINGDGIADMLVSATGLDLAGEEEAGAVYVVFGSESGFPQDLSQLNGSNGFRIAGVDANDLTGSFVRAAGDVNGDGVTDILIGAKLAERDGLDKAGAAYIVYGGSHLGQTVGANGEFDLGDIDSENMQGMVIYGLSGDDFLGFSGDNSGDINYDGIDDIVLGAPGADMNVINRDNGKVYLLFGQGEGVADPGNCLFPPPPPPVVCDGTETLVEDDLDCDTVLNDEDNCPVTPNTGQEDENGFEDGVTEGAGEGDACEVLPKVNLCNLFGLETAPGHALVNDTADILPNSFVANSGFGPAEPASFCDIAIPDQVPTDGSPLPTATCEVSGANNMIDTSGSNFATLTINLGLLANEVYVEITSDQDITPTGDVGFVIGAVDDALSAEVYGNVSVSLFKDGAEVASDKNPGSIAHVEAGGTPVDLPPDEASAGQAFIGFDAAGTTFDTIRATFGGTIPTELALDPEALAGLINLLANRQVYGACAEL